ncbi:MAG TPA: LamG-like jellyroll fold domain-containing protein, partial [Sedimentisphaerales bacterium]|nr:LamG-like jellyroll fold domain-containing protein [Sedimentisphaerales bacterium]
MCKRTICLLSLVLALGLVSTGYGALIDSFENAPGAWEIMNPPETLAQSSEGVTDGSYSLQRNFVAGWRYIDLDITPFLTALNNNDILQVDVTTSVTAEQMGWWFEQQIILQGGSEAGSYYLQGPLVSVASPDGNPKTTTVSFNYRPELVNGPLTGWAKIRLLGNTGPGPDGILYYDNLRVVSAEPPPSSVVIGDFEGGLDNWTAAWEGSPVLANATNGVTSGSGSLSLTTTGGYYCLQWNAPTIPASLADQKLTFDLTMIASEWPVGLWTKVAERVALNSDGASGWKEYANATAIDKVTGEATSLDWGRWWDTAPDVVKTYSVDISDYDLTGATWFQINITVQGGNGTGHFYFDNVQLVGPPPPDTGKSTDTIIGDWEQDLDGWVVGGGADAMFNDHNGVTLGNYSLDVFIPNGDYNQDVLTLNVLGAGLLDLFKVNRELSVDVTRLMADWPTDKGTFTWNGIHMIINAGGDGWNLWQDMGYRVHWLLTDGDQTATATWDYEQYLPLIDFDNLTWLELKVVSNANDPAYTGWVWFYLDNMRLTGAGLVEDPQPADEATDVPTDATLSWTAGTFAATHHVYFGTNSTKVRNADKDSDPDVVFVEISDASFDPNGMAFDTQYFWRVDEVNEANPDSPWTGPVWNFTTANFIVVDDFESYNDIDPPDPASNTIFATWADGYEIPTNGALVGNAFPPYTEQTVVHSGAQAMPLFYDNTGAALQSETQRVWAEPQDWTINGFNSLKLFVHGSPANFAGQLYIIVADGAGGSAKMTYPDSAVFTAEEWKEWVISLDDIGAAGVNVTAVTKLVIGVADLPGQPEANGVLSIDDIRAGFQPIGLVAYYAFENNLEDASGNGHTGTLAGDPNFPATYVTGPTGFGQAMLFDGTDGHQYVSIGTFDPSAATGQLSLALWAKWDGPSASWQGLMGKRNAGDWVASIMMWYFELERDVWDVRFVQPGSGVNTGQTLQVGQWTHLAVTFDGT